MGSKRVTVDQRLANLLSYLCEKEGINQETLENKKGEISFGSIYVHDIKALKETIDYLKDYAKIQIIAQGLSNQKEELESNINDAQADFQRIIDEIKTWGDYIVEGAYCTSNNPENINRKPNTGMVDFFRHAYVMGYQFDNRHALMIGDASGLPGQFSDSDLQCARNAGIKYFDVKQFIYAMHPCYICKDTESPCGAGEYPFLPCTESKRSRLKKALI